jgi:hypothetical protein
VQTIRSFRQMNRSRRHNPRRRWGDVILDVAAPAVSSAADVGMELAGLRKRAGTRLMRMKTGDTLRFGAPPPLTILAGRPYRTASAHHRPVGSVYPQLEVVEILGEAAWRWQADI